VFDAIFVLYFVNVELSKFSAVNLSYNFETYTLMLLQIAVICILGVQMKMAALVWGISSMTFSRTFVHHLVSYLYQCASNAEVVFLHDYL